jgi:serine/threonine protein phosphatase PrpC
MQSYIWNFSDQGPRDSQEDFVFQNTFTLENINQYYSNVVWVVGVVDGHNGDEVSLFLKDYIPNSVKQIIQNKHQHLKKGDFVDLEILKKEIIDVIKNADTVFSKYYPNEEYDDDTYNRDPGAVLSFYVVYNKHILSFQVGDTKILIFDEEGNCIFQTPTHDAYNDSEVQRIKLQGGTICKSRICDNLQPSRVIGDLIVKKAFPLIFLNEPETCIIPMHRRMSLFAVTDGIKTENLTAFKNYAKIIGSKTSYSSSYVDKNLLLSSIIDTSIHDNKTVFFQYLTLW